MDLLTPELRAALVANAQATKEAQRTGAREPDPAPVVKFFSPISAAMWLATELEPDGDTLFGLADLGFGCPELGSFSLGELAAVRLPFDLRIERDLNFSSDVPLSLWVEVARRTGSIMGAAQALRIAREHLSRKLPPGPPDG
ncbi:DUF2958 domain-containing protein [Sphingomonas pruni]|uniref:DUF2958 domain-containing protein n=1 Tax=Sphingomonas pruni TaxID=40683 RepID=UPI000831F450|nr:DUF2958 domain-containing protein [Sphingomonas pruni]